MKLQAVIGFHAVASRLKIRSEGMREIYVDSERSDARMKDLLALAKDKGIRTISVDGKRLDGMTGHARHQGVVAFVEPVQLPQFVDDVLDTLDPAAGPPLLLVLDGITDPHNLGACLRVADAAGVHAVIAPKDKSVGLTAAAMKVASGAAETVPYITVTNLARTLRDLKDRGIWLTGADEDGQADLYAADLSGPMAWVMGAEGDGLRRLTRELCDQIISIPMFGSVESLNVSVASGVCLFESRRQRLAGVEKAAKKGPAK